jgi:gliding motility-associated-like protein
MNKCIFLSFLLCLLVGQVLAQVSIRNLYFNSTSNISRLDYGSNPPQVVYAGIGSGGSIGEGIAHVEDRKGNIVIWVNAKGVYDRNGILMPGSTGILADPSSSEIVICPFPNDTLRYYIIYNQELYSPLKYSVVDLRLRNGLGDVSQLNQALDGTNHYAEGLEVVRIPCSNNYWLLAYQQNKGFMRFKIEAAGIGTPALVHSFVTPDNSGRGELDYHNGRFGLAITTQKKAIVGDFNPVDGVVANVQELNFPNATNGMYGLEFSPDASKVYLSDFYNRNIFGNVAGPNLFRYNFLTGNYTSWTIPYDDSRCVRTDRSQVVEGLGQIELGKDGSLYIPHVFGCQITVVKEANEETPVFDRIDVSTILSHGVSDHIQSNFLQPLQITANQTICEGETVLLTVKGGSNPRWQPITGLSTPNSASTSAKPSTTTTYKVLADNQYGCQDSAFVTVTVSSKVKPAIQADQLVICGGGQVKLSTVTAQASYQWYKNGVLIPDAQADHLSTNLPGQYSVITTNANGCPETSLPLAISSGNVPQATFTVSGATRLCQGETVSLSSPILAGHTYQWYRNNAPVSGQQQAGLRVSESGTYQVKVKNPEGCEALSTATEVEVFEIPVVDLGPDRVSCAGEEVVLMAENQAVGATYQWSDGSQAPALSVSSNGDYQLTVQNGPCSVTRQVKVTFLDETKSKIPNVITPNGDIHNEYFVLPDFLDKVGIAIYNRWGKEVYQSRNYQGEWNAEGLETGLYYYQLTDAVPCFSTKKGWIQVLR